MKRSKLFLLEEQREIGHSKGNPRALKRQLGTLALKALGHLGTRRALRHSDT